MQESIEFTKWPKIERFDNLIMTITQKIHGTNAQIVITSDGKAIPGSRNKYLSLTDDNHGFARFVHDNSNELIDKLGVGRHYGEWAGPGINSGEGLTEKTFILFDEHKWPTDRPLPVRTRVVPVLYKGKFTNNDIHSAWTDLLSHGSKLVPGFMRPEGIVINIGGRRYKKVFEPEETQWTGKGSGSTSPKVKEAMVEVQHLLQPKRVQHLFDSEPYLCLGYPNTLSEICSLYIKDLEDEGQFDSDDHTKALQKKALGKCIYTFIKTCMKENYND